jgi:hypothetical protein
MGRQKRASAAYEKAIKRIAAVRSIDPNFDLGNGLIEKAYNQVILNVKDSLDDYNTTLSIVDDKLNILRENETTLRDWNERILSGVGSKFSKKSSEYEKAGGKRKTERKRNKGKKPPRGGKDSKSTE